MKKKKIDNNSKFLFMMSGFFVLLFSMIFVSTEIGKVTYSANSQGCKYLVGNSCCEEKQSKTSTSNYIGESVALANCRSQIAGNNQIIDNCSASFVGNKYKYIYKESNSSSCIYALPPEALSACQLANYSDCNIASCEDKYKYTYSTNKYSGTYYNNKSEAKAACLSAGKTGCEVSDNPVTVYTYKYDLYTGCEIKKTYSCVEIGNTETYKLCSDGECIDNVTFPDKYSCQNFLTTSGEYNLGCDTFKDGAGNEYYYRIEFDFMNNGTDVFKKQYCLGNGSHCYSKAPEYNCSNDSTFIGWVDSEDDCNAAADAIKAGEDVVGYITPQYDATCTTKTVKKYACCISGKPSSSSSSSSPSSSKPSSSSSPSSSKPLSSAPSSRPASSSVKLSSKPPLPPDNPDTGLGLVAIVGMLGFVMVGYSIWYFKKNEE